MMKARLRINFVTVIDSYPIKEQKEWTNATLVFPILEDENLEEWQKIIAKHFREELGINDVRVELELKDA